LASVCCAWSAPAAARHLAGATQVSLHGSLVSYETNKTTFDSSGNASSGSSSSGSAPAGVTTSSTTYGFLSPVLGAGLGFMVGENVLLGGQFELAMSKIDQGPAEPTTEGTNVMFLPRMEYVFDGDDARFYAAALGGYRYSSATSTLPNNGGSTVVSGSAGVFGFSLGAHGFVSESCSFEPAVTILRSSGSQTVTINTPSLSASGMGNQSLDFSTSGTTVIVSVGIAAWLGASHAARGHSVPVAPEAEATDDDTDDTAAATSPAAEQRVELFGGRALELSVASEPSSNSVHVRLEAATGAAGARLLDCRQVTVMNGAETNVLQLSRSDGEPGVPPFVSVSLPLELVSALGETSNLDVCGESWIVTDRGRAQVHQFLKARRALLGGKPAVTAPPAAAPATTSPAPDAPSPPPSPPPAVESPPEPAK